jgi:hypothetical protein
VNRAHKLYFGCTAVDQDKSWAPHSCYNRCSQYLHGWLIGTHQSMLFAARMVWRKQKDNLTDCCSSLTKTVDHDTKSKHTIVDPSIPATLGLARTSGFLPQRWNSRNVETAAALSWLCARTVKKTLRSHIFHTVSVESVAMCALLLRIRAKRRKRLWVHPIVSQRLLKGQFHKLYEDLRIHPKNSLDILEWPAVSTSFHPWLDQKLPTERLWRRHLCHQKKDWP